ncbi:hypothetical protein EDD16DRAFT_297640 [Pisolithus croceorrhizus]|nr:hypothetical protein EDD16DRAFT_297640 [Pisolithus croceorrhizus]
MADQNTTDSTSSNFAIFIKLQHFLLGLYVWEFIISLDFDWKVLTRKHAFRWPLFFYFSGRYIMLIALVGIIVSVDPPRMLSCRDLVTFNQLAASASLGLACINLAIRTIAVWHNKWITRLIILLVLGHWSLVLQSGLVITSWTPTSGCVIVETKNMILAATSLYAMGFDFIVLCLLAYKLAFTHDLGTSALGRLSRRLISEGILYFVVSFICNSIASLLMIMVSSDAVVGVIFHIPACVASTIASSRVVRRLSTFNTETEKVYSSGNLRNTPLFVGGTLSSRGNVPVDQVTDVRIEMGKFSPGGETNQGTRRHAAEVLEVDEKLAADDMV